MANRFKETVKKVAKKPALNSRNLAKIPWSLDATWHQTLKLHARAVSSELELKTPIVLVVASPAECEILPPTPHEKKTLKH
jgi:hypothetical protein